MKREEDPGRALSFPEWTPGTDLWEAFDALDLDGMGATELRALLTGVEAYYAELEGLEPRDEDGEEYEAWMEALEALDDMMDEIHERLEGIGPGLTPPARP